MSRGIELVGVKWFIMWASGRLDTRNRNVVRKFMCFSDVRKDELLRATFMALVQVIDDDNSDGMCTGRPFNFASGSTMGICVRMLMDGNDCR